MAKIIETLKNISEYPNSFKRQGAFPLDSKSVFQSYGDAEKYAQDKSAAATSYVGQIISVVEDGTVNVYKIKDTAGNLELIGTQADWAATSGVAAILNKPNMRSGVDLSGNIDNTTIILAGNESSQAHVQNGIAVGPESVAGGLAFLVKEVGWYDGSEFASKTTQNALINAFKLITDTDVENSSITINTILKGNNAGSSWSGNGRVVTFQEFDWAKTTIPAVGESFSFQTTRWSPTYTTVQKVVVRDTEVIIVFNDSYALNVTDAALINSEVGELSSSGWCCWFPQRPSYGTVRITDIEGEGSPPGILTCIALGVSAQARNTGAIAIGREVLADGPYSMALTKGATAQGQYAIAASESAVANGEYAVAIGQSASASAIGAIALGRMTSAQGDGAVALGKGTTAGGAQSFAFGKGCQATGNSSVAGGLNSIAQGYVSMAIGSSAQAHGTGAIALGSGTQARGDGAVALGYGQIHDGSNAGWYRYAFAAGKGVARGEGAVAFGQGFAKGAYSFASGTDSTSALGYSSFAFGQGVDVENIGEVAFGKYNAHVKTSEDVIGTAFTIGNGTATQSSNLFAIYTNGDTIITGSLTYKNQPAIVPGSGTNALILGNYPKKTENGITYESIASGAYAISAGAACEAEGNYSIAGGIASHTIGDYSFAMGVGAIAQGETSVALGAYSQAMRQGSMAFGLGVVAVDQGEFVTGRYNYHDETIHRRFVVGDGKDDANRSNAFEIWRDTGDAYLKGTLYIGGTGLNFENAQAVATETQIQALVKAIEFLGGAVVFE